MSEKKTSSVTELPVNYYYNGDPSIVIDRVANFKKLNGNPELAEKRASMVREVLIFCPVPFLDELIEALEQPNDLTIGLLIDKASHGEVNLKTNNLLSNEQKDQISALAFDLLVKKITESSEKKLLPILRFIRDYVLIQKAKEIESNRVIVTIEKQIVDLRKKIGEEQDGLRKSQQDLLLLFIEQLNNSSL